MFAGKKIYLVQKNEDISVTVDFVTFEGNKDNTTTTDVHNIHPNYMTKSHWSVGN